MRHGMNDNRTARTLGLLAGLSLAAGTALAQDYGFDWVTIGDPGNRDTLPHESPWRPNQQIGGVDYEYRTTTGKLGTLDYLEFARAYAPHYEGRVDRREFLGWWLVATPDGFGGWNIDASGGTEGYAASLSWEMAARYANWLHNDKVNEKWAFEDGAYDTSTFVFEDGRYQHQAEHHPDAKFWLPTIDEYAKAAYWDPDKNGGEGGYWLNPDGGDELLFAALPEDDGETIGDLFYDDGYFFGAWDMNQYPEVRSPWGLADVSGTLPDWLETYSNSTTGSRARGGSMAHDIFSFAFDRIDGWDAGTPHNDPWGGLRLVAIVPSVGGLVPICAVALGLLRRERR